MFTDPGVSHRGPVQQNKQGLLNPGPETPFMPTWQTLFRYFLEILASLCLSLWSAQVNGWTGSIWAVLGCLIVWRSFNVRDDPATIDVPCIVVPGVVRVLMEWSIFGLACHGWLEFSKYLDLPYRMLVLWIYIGLIVVYYIVTRERVIWVVRQKDCLFKK